MEVTKQLAYPTSTGGIVVAQLQPANFHPYDMGTDDVIESSATKLK
jgi:hypothetical protein